VTRTAAIRSPRKHVPPLLVIRLGPRLQTGLLYPIQKALRELGKRLFPALNGHSLDPMTLATVMAGLPYVSWRHSLNRCRKAGDEAAPGHTYKAVPVASELCSKRAKDWPELW